MAAALLMFYGYRRYGTVWLATRALKSRDFEKAAALLAQVRSPATLSRQQRAYYELSMGTLALEGRNGTVADGHFRAALSCGLRTENDRAVTEFSLAQAAVLRDDESDARSFLASARGRARKPALVAMINELQVLLDAEPA